MIALRLVPGLALVCVGCALPARALSSPDEYEAYRQTRVAHSVEDRLASSERYLSAHAKGRFFDEVRDRFTAEEGGFYDAKSTSIDGLVWYLTVLPNGPHAAVASLRIADLEASARRAREDTLVAMGRSNEARFARASRSRQATVDLLVGFIGATAAVRSWGQPTWALPGDLIFALRGEPSPGRCDDRGCIRTVTPAFQIPVAGGGLEDRAATIDLAITLERGGVREITVRGPELFSRLFEASRGVPLDPDKERGRVLAVSFALELVGGAFEATMPMATCDRPITPPVIMKRACSGLSLEVVVGDTPVDDDIVRLRGR